MSSGKANLYKRKYTIQKIKETKEYINKWESILCTSNTNQQWFPHWLLHWKYKELDKLQKRLVFLKKQAKQIKEDEQQESQNTSVEHETRSERKPRQTTFTEYDKEAIKQIPVLSILEQAGFQIIQTSSNRAKTHCPFHTDNNPSLNININDNYVHCFACNTSADSIKLYQVIHNVDFINALKELSLYI